MPERRRRVWDQVARRVGDGLDVHSVSFGLAGDFLFVVDDTVVLGDAAERATNEASNCSS
ncbi:hypothetical protein ACWFRM_37345 [Streptomyces sp. NPDC055144]